jgi:UDP-glucose 4-epimerase
MDAYRRACVTGGAGFIGSHLAAALLRHGLDVIVVDDLSTGDRDNLAAGAEFVEATVLDTEVLAEIVRGCDIVFHLAARVAVRSSWEAVVQDTTTNVVGSASILRAVQHAGTIRKFVYASSMAVYGESDRGVPLSETHPATPRSPYGISKLSGEWLTHRLGEVAGIESVVLRLFNVYGGGQRASGAVGVVTWFASQLARGVSPVIFGDGEQHRDFVHVDDVVQAFLGAMDMHLPGDTINVGSGHGTTVNRVVEELRRVMACGIGAIHAAAGPGELRHAVADISRAHARLRYQPRYRFPDRLDEIARHIEACPAGQQRQASGAGGPGR